MKKRTLQKVSLYILTFYWVSTIQAQQGIQFENNPTHNWKSIIQKARQEKKLIFLDCTAGWCGPCKQMEKNVFTQKDVGMYFNKNFINVHYDIEKDADGEQLAIQFAVEALPNMLFINPANEQLVERLIGETEPDVLLKQAAVAQERYTNPVAMAAYQAEVDKNIHFENTVDWAFLIDKAKRENKLLLLELYDGNGGHQVLEKRIFIQDSVYNYLNTHFVSARYNMDKEDAKINMDKMFSITGLPVIVFVDAYKNEAIHQLAPPFNTEKVLEAARAANDPHSHLAAMKKRYDAGERAATFMWQYLSKMTKGNLLGQDKVALQYLDVLTAEQLLEKENWDYFVKFVTDPLALSFQKVMANRSIFYDKYGRNTVDYLLNTAINNAVSAITQWAGSDKMLVEKNNTALINYLKSVDYAVVPGALAHLYTAASARKKEYEKVWQGMRYALQYNVLGKSEMQKYLQKYMSVLVSSNSKPIVTKALQLIDDNVHTAVDFTMKAHLMTLKGEMQAHTGDAEGAQKSRALAAKYAQEAEQQGGWLF